MRLKIGMRVKGKVTGVQPYGVFVDLGDHQQGLIHISECQAGYVSDIHELFKIGDAVEPLIIDIDQFSGKISLSVRSLIVNFDVFQQSKYNRPQRIHYWTNYRQSIGFSTISRVRNKWLIEAKKLF